MTNANLQANKILVAYFTTSGITKKAATALAPKANWLQGADLTNGDINGFIKKLKL